MRPRPPSPALLLAGAALAAAAAPTAGAAVLAYSPAGEPAREVVVPGVSYERQVRAGGQVVHIVRARPVTGLSAGPLLTAGSPLRRERLDTALRAAVGVGPVAAINGDFFNFSSSHPSGALIAGGRLYNEPEATRSALIIGPGLTLRAARLALAGEWQPFDRATGAPDQVRTFGGLNRPAERGSETILYTPALGRRSTPAGDSLFEVRIRLDSPGPIVPGGVVTGTVVRRSAGGGETIGAGHVVLTGVGASGAALSAQMPLGRGVRILTGIEGLPDGAVGALGGGPLLVRDGAPVGNAGEGFTVGQIAQRTSRSAVGQRADGTILLVSAEGPLQGSPGISVPEQADLLAGLDARTAVAMDGGGSAQLAVFDRLRSDWSVPRRITDAFVLGYDGVRFPAPPRRLTPNGDDVGDAATLDLATTRRGRVLLTIRRRSGSPARRLRNRGMQPGSLATLLDPAALRLPDGVYEVRARFTPSDGSPPTEQTRRILLDRTLAGLTVRPSLVRVGRRPVPRVAVRFRLTRPARVTLRVRDADGRALVTPVSGRVLRTGRHRLVWNRRAGGRTISGRVTIQVESRNRFGRSGLQSSVRLAPPPRPRPAS